MFQFQKPQIEIVDISLDRKYGKFVIEPLERGYATTLGNSLRRILLSSLPGVAASSIRINGVQHEFSTIPGVKEDVVEIILNIKSLAMKCTSEDVTEKTLYIDVAGERKVTAADIQADSDIEIVNKDLHIATLGDVNAKLYMEINITRGRGYRGAEKNKNEDDPIGVIAIDSIYTPITKVNFMVLNTRVEQVIDYDKLVMEVWTNGTIQPDEAISLAAKIMNEHLNLFIDLSENAKKVEIMVKKEEDETQKILDTTIEELDFSVRSYNCLKRAGINTVGELTQKTETELIKVRNLGKKSIDEVMIKLKDLGLNLRKDEE
ncbi:MAG: DNA-directed RNA polymerase subunit alpha [Clostridiales bacterium GWE2_32_10]|nr:MAG: DNA-directed RNA polymerase subunit alpha [Clostridiales bacterium GWE2_32_10]HBY21426.1 DNA-directed RNA polymerase subunit alpha [Clostridiales bacterium]